MDTYACIDNLVKIIPLEVIVLECLLFLLLIVLIHDVMLVSRLP